MVRVSTCKTVDIECEVDVDLDDVLTERWREVEEGKAIDRWRLVTGPIDTATRLLASVPESLIEEFPPFAVHEIVRRLKEELERYENLPAAQLIHVDEALAPQPTAKG